MPVRCRSFKEIDSRVDTKFALRARHRWAQTMMPARLHAPLVRSCYWIVAAWPIGWQQDRMVPSGE
jgi:hypothetical protein